MGASSSVLFHNLELNESLLVWTLPLSRNVWESPHPNSAVTWKWMGVSSSELCCYLELNRSLLIRTLLLAGTEWESPHLNSVVTWNWMGVSSSELCCYLELNGSLLIWTLLLPGTEWESPHFIPWNWMGVFSSDSSSTRNWKRISASELFRYLELNGGLLIWTVRPLLLLFLHWTSFSK